MKTALMKIARPFAHKKRRSNLDDEDEVPGDGRIPKELMMSEKVFRKLMMFSKAVAGVDPNLIQQLVEDASRIQQEGQTKILVSQQLFQQIQAALANYQIQKQQVDGMTVDRIQSFESMNTKSYQELCANKESIELEAINNPIEFAKKDDDEGRFKKGGFRDIGTVAAGGAAGAGAGALIAHGIYQGSKKHDASSAKSPWLYRSTQKESKNAKGETIPARKGLGLGTKDAERAISRNKDIGEFKPPVNKQTGSPYSSQSEAFKKAKAKYEKTKKAAPGKVERNTKRIAGVKRKIYTTGIAGGAALGVAGAGIYAAISRENKEQAKRRYARGMNKDGASKFRGRTEFSVPAPRAKSVRVLTQEQFEAAQKKRERILTRAKRAGTTRSSSPGFNTPATTPVSPGY